MKISVTNAHWFRFNVSTKIAVLLILSVLCWATGVPFLKTASAANFTNVSDTITDSDRGVAAGHTFVFTTQSILDTGGGSDTIYFDFDPIGDNFEITDLDVTDFVSETGLTVVAACGGGASEFTLATTTEDFTLTICAGDTVATSTTITLPIASSTSVITNPDPGAGNPTSYVIHIESRNQGSGAAILDQADTRVAIIDDVVVTASVDTSLTFTISAVPAGVLVNGVTTSTSTTATAIGFGILPTAANSSTTAAQRLNVATNAANGFTVTVKQDQNLTSSTGADIDVFQNAQGTAVPIAWASPANTLGNENTYGHFGVTSDDSTLSASQIGGSDAFGTALFAGNFATTTLPVFYHNGPSDGTTADIGSTTVAYRIGITALQEAGADYTNTLTYVATPIF